MESFLTRIGQSPNLRLAPLDLTEVIPSPVISFYEDTEKRGHILSDIVNLASSTFNYLPFRAPRLLLFVEPLNSVRSPLLQLGHSWCPAIGRIVVVV